MTRIDGDGFELMLEWRGDYLYARVNGPHDTFEISHAYWSLVAEACRARGAKRVLVVENLAELGGMMDLERMIDALVEMGFRDIRLAFVDLIEDHLPDMEHGEIMAREREITARVFAREDDAERWLRYGVE